MTATVPDDSATPTLLVEQARAFVQAEEARFAASQSRATALLAVAGVIASLGGGVLTGLDGRHYDLSVRVNGAEIPVVLALVIAVGAVAIVTLLWSGATAIGALREEPESESKSNILASLVKHQFPTWLSEATTQSSGLLLALLAGQRDAVREANTRVNDAIKRAARLLGVAVASGLLLSVILLFGTTAKHRQVYLVKDSGKNSIADRGSR